MSEPESFHDLMRRVCAGEARAAEELVRRYEGGVRLEVRCRLRDQRLRRLFDSLDVCQSVLASFFPRAAAAEYDLDRPDQLVGLLVSMARHKLASAARRQARLKRDLRRDAGGDGLGRVAAGGASPSEQAAGRELLERFQAALDAEERQLVELRGQGLSWAEVAQRLGGTAQARRMQLARAVDRVRRELGLADADG
jgi:RNA polymerase sigma-70 factor (ECF subfamily)